MINEAFTQDEYGEVLNSTDTYKAIADVLESRGSVVIGWTDEAGSHLDILFTLHPIQVGSLQRGMRWTDLFVSISSFGMHGFDIDDEELHYGYIGEKLNLGINVTSEKVGELINGVKKLLC